MAVPILGLHIYGFLEESIRCRFFSSYQDSSLNLGDSNLHKLIRSVLMPFLVFDIAYLFYEPIFNTSFTMDWTSPGFAMWFLLVLFIYRMIFPFLIKIRIHTCHINYCRSGCWFYPFYRKRVRIKPNVLFPAFLPFRLLC